MHKSEHELVPIKLFGTLKEINKGIILVEINKKSKTVNDKRRIVDGTYKLVELNL